MKHSERKPTEELPALRLEYIMHAAWFYYRTVGNDEGFSSSLHRMAAGQVASRITALGHELPSQEEIYAYAAERWPADRLHEAPKIGAKEVPEGRTNA